MNINSDDVKFSNVTGESDEAIYERLIKFIMMLCNQNHNPNYPMMEYDEIFGELLEELAKGLKHYKDLPVNQKLAVIRRMLDNRISELRYKYYVTHRKQSINDVSYEQKLEEEDSHSSTNKEANSVAMDRITEEPMPESLMMSVDRVSETRKGLSPTAMSVFDCLVHGNNPRLENILAIHVKRASTRTMRAQMIIKPWMVADAMLLSEEEVNKAFIEIRTAYRKVCND